MQWKKFWVAVAAAVLLVVGVVAIRWLAGSSQSGIVVEGIVVNTKPMHLVATPQNQINSQQKWPAIRTDGRPFLITLRN